MAKSIGGFTIVELVVVVSVIAILAVITTASYGGIQQRARNTQVITGVAAYQRALVHYSGVHSAYPTNNNSCLGANYPSNQCWVGPAGTYGVNSTFDNLMQPYLGETKPIVSTNLIRVSSNNDQRGGALYRYVSQTDVRIIYYLNGRDQDCGLGGATGSNTVDATQCQLWLPAP